jgi:GntR family transcriptional regulator, transcriptional repressor for pyruvate dehydrogenase complex
MDGVARRRTIAEDLHKDLLNGIVSGEFPPNGRLPTETRLAHDYGVSRSTVRIALARLREGGYITSRQGSGSVVVDTSEGDTEHVVPVDSLADLERGFEARISLEGEIAYFAALRHDAKAARFFEAHLEAMHKLVTTGEHHASEDMEFHMVLAAASGNQLFESIVSWIRPYILFGMNVSKILPRPIYRRHAFLSYEEHRVIIEAARARDAEGARTAMRTHLENSRRRLFEGP